MVRILKDLIVNNKLTALITALLVLAALLLGITEEMYAVSAEEGVRLPIIMYHSVLKSAKKQTKYIVTPEQLERDLMWLKENGYTGIFMSELIDYVYNGTDLPEKPVMITFDDGYYNNLIYAYPLLVKYGMKAVISVVGKYSESFSESGDLNPAYAHLTWDNIREMSESGYIEIQNHSYDLHSNTKRQGASIMKNESLAAYRKVLTEDVLKLQSILSEKCSVTPNTFTYPYGYLCEESEALLREMGFKASLSCYERVNFITRDEGCLWGLKRFNRDSTLSTERFMSKIDV